MKSLSFGQFVRALRERRSYDRQGHERKWSQEELAKHVVWKDEPGLKTKKRRIASMEQDKVVNLKPHLEPLARAFGLSEAEKTEFYTLAGYIYTKPASMTMDKSVEVLKSLFRDLDYPASARTPLWDFIAFNAYHYSVWNFTDEQI